MHFLVSCAFLRISPGVSKRYALQKSFRFDVDANPVVNATSVSVRFVFVR